MYRYTILKKLIHEYIKNLKERIEVTAYQCSYDMYLPNGSPSVQTVQTAQQKTTATPTGNLIIIIQKGIFIQQQTETTAVLLFI
mgnify:CR=1 FL=1